MGREIWAEEIMASIQLQMKLSVKCEAIVPIEKAEVRKKDCDTAKGKKD